MEKLFNVKASRKHAALEKKLRLLSAQDISRSDILKEAVISAKEIQDWYPIYLLYRDFKPDNEAPHITSWQAKYEEDIEAAMAEVRSNMEASLIAKGVISRILQNQFFLALLLTNLLEIKAREHKSEQICVKSEEITSEDITIPDMAALFTELLLTDRNSKALIDIKRILLEWRKKSDETLYMLDNN